MVLVAINIKSPSESTFIEVEDGEYARIGRKPETDKSAGELPLKITWNDRLVSRNHCRASRQGRNLVIERLEPAEGHSKPNALFTLGKIADREMRPDPVTLTPGERKGERKLPLLPDRPTGLR